MSRLRRAIAQVARAVDAVLTVVFVTAVVGILGIALGAWIGLVEIGRRLMVGP